MALRIARYWGREPHWFYTLDTSTRISVMAEYQLSHESPEDRKKRIEQQRLEQERKMWENRDG